MTTNETMTTNRSQRICGPGQRREDFALACLRNVGVDTSCGACCEIAFTGATTHGHTCANPPPPIVVTTTRTKLLKDLTGADIPRGLSAEDVAIDHSVSDEIAGDFRERETLSPEEIDRSKCARCLRTVNGRACLCCIDQNDRQNEDASHRLRNLAILAEAHAVAMDRNGSSDHPARAFFLRVAREARFGSDG